MILPGHGHHVGFIKSGEECVEAGFEDGDVLGIVRGFASELWQYGGPLLRECEPYNGPTMQIALQENSYTRASDCVGVEAEAAIKQEDVERVARAHWAGRAEVAL
jgi:hypothetical protein